MFKKIDYKNLKFAWSITWKYALFGVSWIAFSDQILSALVTDLTVYSRLQTVKGWLFIIITSLFIYMLVKNMLYKVRMESIALEKECEDYKTYFESAGAGMVVMDLDRKIFDVNGTFCEMTGLSREQLINLDYENSIHPEDFEAENMMIQKMKNGKIDRFDISKRMTLNGKKVWIHESMKAILDDEGNVLKVVTALFDISDIKRQVEKCQLEVQMMERIKEEDAKVIARLKEELELAQKSLIASERMATLGGLISGFTHEINTPIGVSLTTNSFMRKQYKEVKEGFANQTLSKNELERFFEELDESLELMNNNLERAADYILSFKQNAVDQSNFTKRTFNLKKVIKDCLASIKPLMKHSDFEVVFECPDDISLYTFPGAVSHIISNLVLNAVKHGFEDISEGTIKVIVSTVDDQVSLLVSDNGNGIQEHAMKKIYTPFYTTKADDGGTGLGLSIVYDLVTESLDGSIDCDSVVGQGTEFKILFPIITEEN